jgi:hypothetical protein
MKHGRARPAIRPAAPAIRPLLARISAGGLLAVVFSATVATFHIFRRA